jgi:hypothetical protein
MKNEILEAKKKLYSLLLTINPNDLTDNEVEIMFLLSNDEQIQNIFKNNL